MRLKGSLSNCIEFSILQDLTMTGKIASSNITFFFAMYILFSKCNRLVFELLAGFLYSYSTFRYYKLYLLALSETRKSHKPDYLPYIKMQHVRFEIFTVTEIERKIFVVKLNKTRHSILLYICKISRYFATSSHKLLLYGVCFLVASRCCIQISFISMLQTK